MQKMKSCGIFNAAVVM